MKKKIVVMLSLVLCLMLSISLAACNNNKHEAKSEWKFDSAQHWHECATKGHEDKLDVADHTWNDGEITTPPTETAEGVKTYTCTVCGATKTAPVEKLTHTHTFATEWSKDATNHWYAATCEHTEEVKDKAAHNWNDGEITTAPTETTDGVKTFTCTVCGATKTAPVEKLTHKHTFDMTNWETSDTHHWHKATCAHTDEKDGYAVHAFGEWTTKTKADYGVDKVEERTCTVCKKHQERTIENSALAPKTNNVIVDDIDFTYNGQPHSIDSLITAGNKAGMVIKYVGVDGTTYEESTTAPKNAGTYKYTITIPATAEWKEAEKTNTFTIEKGLLFFDLTNMTKVYDGTADFKYDCTTANGLVDGDECSISFVAKYGTDKKDCINAGVYENVSTESSSLKLSNSNYAFGGRGYLFSGANTKLTITKMKLGNFDLNVSASDLSGTGSKIISFALNSKVAKADEGKVYVKVAFDTQQFNGTSSLDLTTNDVVEQGQAKIEFKTDGDSAYLNYEFDTENLGTISRV